LKRLARGLASSRQGARQGFAAALAATLAQSAAGSSTPAKQKGSKKKAVAAAAAADATPALQAPFVSAAGVLALLDACLEVTGSMKGSVSVHEWLLTLLACSQRSAESLPPGQRRRPHSSSAAPIKHQPAAPNDRRLVLQGCQIDCALAVVL
jgi:hypothetical protein